MKSQISKILVTVLLTLGIQSQAHAAAKVMNPGEAIGQLVYLTAQDVTGETPKYKSINPLSIPVFGELPMDMSVVAGAITLKQQNLLSHVQLKSRARGTPNLDISELEGGISNALFTPYPDGSWIKMVLGTDGSIHLEASTEAQAQQAYESKQTQPVTLQADLTETRILRTQDMTSADFIRVGSKAANYAQLAKFLNTPERNVVRNGFGIPFAHYQNFIDSNPNIKQMVDSILRDPLMAKVARTSYREAKLSALRAAMTSPTAIVNPQLIDELISKFDQLRDQKGLPRKMKLRSSTNSEDLPNFNGAGLYDSASYKPYDKKVELSLDAKRAALKTTLQTVWASVWNLRAYDERAFFKIPHADVKMGIQVNPSFKDEGADGVVVTKNVIGRGRGVYIETQRGDTHSVANPLPTVKPMKVLVLFNENDVLKTGDYRIQVLQNSNIADDLETILPQDNPTPVMSTQEILDLTYQVLKAEQLFKPILGANNPDFALDLEFKVDAEDTGSRQVYLKQARPYID